MTASARSTSSRRSRATRAATASPMHKAGDAKAAMQDATKIFRGEYRTRYVYHAQMEPLNATAAVAPDGKSAEVWAGTQGPSHLITEVAGAADRTPEASPPSAMGSAAAYGRRWQTRGRARRGAAVEGGRQAGQADLEPRGRHHVRKIPADDGALYRGRLRR